MRRLVRVLVVCLAAAAWGGPAGAAEPEPPPLPSPFEFVPVRRPGPTDPRHGASASPLWAAEGAFLAGNAEDALSRYLDLAYNAPDDERKGFVWMRVGELLLSRGDLKEALSAADSAIRLSRAKYFVFSAMALKFRIYDQAKMRAEAREIASYLLEQGYLGIAPSRLLEAMARADAESGKAARAVSRYNRAIRGAAAPEEEARLRAERDAFINGVSDIPALRDAAESDDNSESRAHLYLVLGKVASREGFTGLAAFALDKAARVGGAPGKEASELLFRIEKIVGARPKIVGLVPLTGKFADIGFAVLSGAEVALRAGGNGDPGRTPVLRWADTGGEPERARRLFAEFSADRSVIGFLGPVSGEEGRSVGVAFGPKSPPVLYLGQKPIPEKPFLYSFGLTPLQEARAVLARLTSGGKADVVLFNPENGYGKGFAEALAAAARETGARLTKSIPYPPGQTDFTGLIKKTVGAAAFSRQARSRGEKGKGIKLPAGGIVIADRWDRVFQLAVQLRYYNVYLPLAGFSGWNDEELIRKAGDAVSGAIFSVDYADAVPGAQGQNFRRDFQDAMRASPSRFEAMGYDGATLLHEAYDLEIGKERRAAGDAARERLPRLKTFRGVTGFFQFGASGEMRRRVFLLRVELGNFVSLPDS